MSKSLTTANDDAEPERFQEVQVVELGQWYWVKPSKGDEDEDDAKKPWLGCVVDIGSNYFGLKSPRKYAGTTRIHVDDFPKVCTQEKDPRSVIDREITRYKTNVQTLLAEIKELTQHLGVSTDPVIEQQGEARSLSVLNAGSQDMKKYKRSLIKAQEKTLPDLFKAVKENNEHLATWMSADILTVEARLGNMEDCVEAIKDRIFHVELYAGLTEDIQLVRDGKPAAREEKLHLMQGRLFMDEECLIDYDAGGMGFDRIDQFNDWLCRPHNLATLLPFQRCMVAFQVRRLDKERNRPQSLIEAFINIQLDQEDKLTFLYIRNGEKVFLITTKVELREKLFPDVSEFDFNEPLMAKDTHHKEYSLITKRAYDDLLEKERLREQEYKAWAKANPGKHSIHNPHNSYHDRLARYTPFDQSNVEYDDIKASIATDMKYYNRIVLILQGLFDRSEVLHPHLPAKLYDPASFAQTVTLVYDRDRALYAGTPPDFEVFRAQCNKLLTVGSVIVGQRDAWRKREKERREEDEGSRYGRDRERYVRYPDPGPPFLAKATVVRKGTVSCEYTRPRQKATGGKSWRLSAWDRKAPAGSQAGDPIAATITVNRSDIFNVSAYTPGDYKLFFADPRTRANYLKWAPYLLAAEDYHAGKRKVGRAKDEE